jgi:hypothetical protein
MHLLILSSLTSLEAFSDKFAETGEFIITTIIKNICIYKDFWDLVITYRKLLLR